MRSIEEVIRQFEHVCWYPSAGSDFRALLFLSDWYYKKFDVPTDEGQVLPDLFVMTDYLGLGSFYAEESFWGDAYEQIGNGYCEPGSCLLHVAYENTSTDIVVTRYEKLRNMSLPYDYRLDCREEPEAYNSAFLIEVEVVSRAYDEIHRYETSVLYAAAENRMFADRIVSRYGLKMEYLVIMNYGAGCGGGNKIGFEWMFDEYKDLGIRYVVSNHGVRSCLAEYGTAGDYPELRAIYWVDGVKWTRGNTVVWYRV